METLNKEQKDIVEDIFNLIDEIKSEIIKLREQNGKEKRSTAYND